MHCMIYKACLEQFNSFLNGITKCISSGYDCNLERGRKKKLNICKGICDRYKTKKVSPYVNGVVWCSICQVFMKINEDRCPCCHCQARKKPLIMGGVMPRH